MEARASSLGGENNRMYIIQSPSLVPVMKCQIAYQMVTFLDMLKMVIQAIFVVLGV